MSTGDPEFPPFQTDPSRDAASVGESWAQSIGRAIESIGALLQAFRAQLPDEPPDVASESSGNYADLGAGGLVIGSQAANEGLTFSATNPATAPVVSVASGGELMFNGSSYMSTGPVYAPYAHVVDGVAPIPPDQEPGDRWLDGERAIKLREAARSV